MKNFLLSILFLIAIASHGQSFFNKTIGDTTNQVWIINSAGTSDGGFLLCGGMKNYMNEFNSHAVLIKLNSQGDTNWTAILSDTTSVFNCTVELPSSQGYICAGKDVMCLIDTSGNLVWRKDGYPGPLSSILLSGNSLLLTSFGGNALIRTDFNGNIIWATGLGISSTMGEKADLLETAGGDIFIAGGRIDIYGVNPALYKLDGSGNLLWTRSYSFYDYNINSSFTSIDTTFDGKLLLVAQYGDRHWTWNNIEYAKVDTDGTAIWTRFLPRWNPYYSGGEIFPLSANTYGLIGYCESFGFRMFFLTMDSSGIPQTTKLFPVTPDGYGSSVAHLNNNHLLSTSTINYGKISKIFLTDSVGNSYCDIIDTTAIVVDTTFIPDAIINHVVGGLTVNIYSTADSLRRGIPIETDCLLTNAEFADHVKPKPEFMIFPNPATNRFEVRSWKFGVGYSFENETTLKIFNTLGEEIFSAMAADSGPWTVDCEHFPRGIYLVRIFNPEKQVTQKVILE